MKLKHYILFTFIGAMFIFTSCESDLDIELRDQNITLADEIFVSEDAYKQALAGIYANLSLSSLTDPGGTNIGGLDAGTGQYIRGMFNLQTLSTDEAIFTFENDPGIRGVQRNSASPENVLLRGVYSRAMFSVALSNEFLRQSTEEILQTRGITSNEITTFRAEAKALKALSYYHLMDMFGKAPFYDETMEPGFTQGEELSREELFDLVESLLIEAREDLPAGNTGEYARVNQGVVDMILAKIYLNAEVYTGTPRYAEALSKCEDVINAGYSLVDEYQFNFLADNDTNGAQNEIIFPISNDGQTTQNFGGTTILIQGQVGAQEENGESLGVNPGGFGGLFRLRPEFSDKFLSNSLFEDDSRNTLITENRPSELDITDPNTGYVITKYSNRTSTGGFGSDRTFTDTDFPMFRLADAYLMYAEAHLRGGGGDAGTALGYVNALRERAFGDNSGNISSGQLDLNFIIDERARELYWENHRRQDLIRFGLYTGNQYIWSFKGGPRAGTSIDGFRALYPIPAASLATNQNLTQNSGY
ncbi:RagB/SusD family nutrient uptake outer membrane protein [Psychroflexus montanilacus]|uniref:RagB/SusD family nutrient uptake outer membrane protein n=1 Tax=Psychroflexus montanilacus TaxID=2873598 RepID=UPI001CCABA7E|nr:RagB/SusD family nutrient uptake outer membrane protein [Psychroflexus montanilacus]MBZ9653054.1 RagB/SusD family nutrient uptake outer membrane protein [Psychroflexus montanilacus]